MANTLNGGDESVESRKSVLSSRFVPSLAPEEMTSSNRYRTMKLENYSTEKSSNTRLSSFILMRYYALIAKSLRGVQLTDDDDMIIIAYLESPSESTAVSKTVQKR
jgi:hypothetical protein